MSRKPFTVFTHRNVDLDNVISVILFNILNPNLDVKLEFVNADWPGPVPENAIALDINAGGEGLKGERDPDGTVHSCAAMVVERFADERTKQALGDLVRVVDAFDAHGKVITTFCPDVDVDTFIMLENTSLVGVYRALKAYTGRNDGSDLMVIEMMHPIVMGMLKNERKRMQALAIIEKGKQVTISKSGKVALVKNARNGRVNEQLYLRFGVQAIVFVDRNNIGVTRSPHIDLDWRTANEETRAVVKAAGELDKWFEHSAGFLFCRGSGKSPAETRSKVNIDQLFEAVDRSLTT